VNFGAFPAKPDGWEGLPMFGVLVAVLAVIAIGIYFKRVFSKNSSRGVSCNGCPMGCPSYKQCRGSCSTQAVLKSPKLETQQREAVVQERSLPPIPVSVSQSNLKNSQLKIYDDEDDEQNKKISRKGNHCGRPIIP
jgi:hypothetical protein